MLPIRTKGWVDDGDGRFRLLLTSEIMCSRSSFLVQWCKKLVRYIVLPIQNKTNVVQSLPICFGEEQIGEFHKKIYVFDFNI
jgi:hypothetical protein